MQQKKFSQALAFGALVLLACRPGADERSDPTRTSDEAPAAPVQPSQELRIAPPSPADQPPREATQPALGGPTNEETQQNFHEQSQLKPETAPPMGSRCVPGPPSQKAQPVDPQKAAQGARMLVQRGEKWSALPLQKTRFDSVVVGTIAETTVTQVFHNPYKKTIEAIYTFPLADEGAVDEYTIRIGERLLRGNMMLRNEAREVYTKARERGQNAGLLEQERTNIFTQHLANIPPGGSVEVTIHVVQALSQEKGRLELVFPTAIGERYTPQKTDSRPLKLPPSDRLDLAKTTSGAIPCPPLEISVAIEAGALPIQGLASQYHTVDVDRAKDGVLVELAQAGELLGRDFVLSWALRGDTPRASLITQADPQGQGGYFSLTLMPPRTFAKESIRGRELIFIIDSSGSMHGAPIKTAKAVVEHALANMRSEDRFQILNFSSSTSVLGPAPIANTSETRERATTYLQEINSLGGTEMLRGIRTALQMPHNDKRLRLVLLLTDGYISNEQSIFTLLDQEIGEARLFGLGIGSSVNRHLLNGIARYGRGAVTYIGEHEPEKVVIDRFYGMIDNPVLTDLSIDWGEFAVESVLPSRIPDLFAGQPVVVFGKYSGEPTGTIYLNGSLAGEPVRIPAKIDFSRATNARGLASMWARKQVDDWLGPQRFRDPGEKHRQLAIALAIERGIMTEYTSFVAVEEGADNDTGSKTAATPQAMYVSAGQGHRIPKRSVTGYGKGAGSGFGGRGKRAPKVRQAKAKVSGALSSDVIRRIIRAHLNEVRFCYEQGLQLDPNLEGRLVVRFTIDAKGRVAEAEISTSVGDKTVDRCVARAVKRWKFPSPAGGGLVQVLYPFELLPG